MSSFLASHFFAYAKKREDIRLRKEAGDPWPWTDDPILQENKFTNIYRENDRTSRELIEMNYAIHEDAPLEDILLNCALARYFGRADFIREIGWQESHSYDKESIRYVAKQRRENKEKIFTGAYVITNGGIAADKEDVVLDYYIDGLHDVVEFVCDIAVSSGEWEQVARRMRKIEGFGGSGFMTKEVLLDTTYTKFWKNSPHHLIPERPAIRSLPSDWYTWTPIGPGARRGVARLLGHMDVDDYEAKRIQNNEAYCLEQIMTLSNMSVHHGLVMGPHDVQFVLCEFDKYERVKLGQGQTRSKYRPPKG